jgi:hypothetical protein
VARKKVSPPSQVKAQQGLVVPQKLMIFAVTLVFTQDKENLKTRKI